MPKDILQVGPLQWGWLITAHHRNNNRNGRRPDTLARSESCASVRGAWCKLTLLMSSRIGSYSKRARPPSSSAACETTHGFARSADPLRALLKSKFCEPEDATCARRRRAASWCSFHLRLPRLTPANAPLAGAFHITVDTLPWGMARQPST